MAFISPYNDIDVIAGQGTIGMELHKRATGLIDDFAAVFVLCGRNIMLDKFIEAVK